MVNLQIIFHQTEAPVRSFISKSSWCWIPVIFFSFRSLSSTENLGFSESREELEKIKPLQNIILPWFWQQSLVIFMHGICCRSQLDIIFPQTVKLILQQLHGAETTWFYFWQISGNPSWTNGLLNSQTLSHISIYVLKIDFTWDVFLASTMTYFLLKYVCSKKVFQKIDDPAITVVKYYINISHSLNKFNFNKTQGNGLNNDLINILCFQYTCRQKWTICSKM